MPIITTQRYIYEIDLLDLFLRHMDLFQNKEVKDTRMKINTRFTFEEIYLYHMEWRHIM